MNLYSYNEKDNVLHIFWPHFVESVEVKTCVDKDKVVVFEDEYGLDDFLNYLEDNGIDKEILNVYSFGDWEVRAVSLSDLVELKLVA